MAAGSTFSNLETDPDPDLNAEDEIIAVSLRGDIILTVPCHSYDRLKSFRVSTNVLSHASPVFDRLFHGQMDEANKLKGSENSPVHLSDDDGDAMEVILRVLHHDTCGVVIPTELEAMASVALHCDKYDCYSILRPWVAQWLLPIRQVKGTATSLGLQLFIAFNLRDSNHFSKIFAQASTDLSSDFASEWENHDLLHLLPEKIVGRSLDAIQN
jgi:hypothetical protein